MKWITLILLVAGFVLPNVSGARERYSKYINPDEFERVLIDGYGRLKRNGDRLEIKLDKGIKVYQNTVNKYGSSKFWVIDIYHPPAKNKFALIGVQAIPPYYELINLGSGKIIILTGVPVFSLNGKRFIETTLDLEAGEYINSVRVFMLNNNEFEQEWKYQYKQDRGPSNPVWLNDTEFMYFVNTYRDNDPASGNLVRRPVIVKYVNGKWTGPESLQ